MAETWRPIPGYEGLYEVSDKGRVKRLPRIAKDGTELPKKYITKWKTDKYGHKAVALRDADGHYKHWFVHRLVLLAFVGPCPEGMEVCHNDSNGSNNRLENLRYDTRQGNTDDRNKAFHAGLGKLKSEDEVRALRADREAGMSYTELGAKYGITRESAFSIVKGKSYAWVK